MCYVILMFIDLFIDWGNPSRLTSGMLLIVLGKPYKIPVGLELPHLIWLLMLTSSCFCNILDASIMIYKDCTSDHKCTLYSLAIRKAICVLKLIFKWIKLHLL